MTNLVERLNGVLSFFVDCNGRLTAYSLRQVICALEKLSWVPAIVGNEAWAPVDADFANRSWGTTIFGKSLGNGTTFPGVLASFNEQHPGLFDIAAQRDKRVSARYYGSVVCHAPGKADEMVADRKGDLKTVANCLHVKMTDSHGRRLAKAPDNNHNRREPFAPRHAPPSKVPYRYEDAASSSHTIQWRRWEQFALSETHAASLDQPNERVGN